MVMCDVTVSCTSLEKDKRVGVEEYVCIFILNFSLCRIYLKDFTLGVYIFIYFHFYYYFEREKEKPIEREVSIGCLLYAP